MSGWSSGSGALAGIRVLDVTGEIGNYCGKLFADLGADVILVEPPWGIDTRNCGPWLDERPGPERSLSFAYLNAGKRGIVLDLASAEGRAALHRLALQADLIVDSAAPAGRSALGLGAEDIAAMRKANPRLVATSVTPFGLTGPCAEWEADDLTLLALGGLLYLGGYHDGPPVAAYGHQAYMAAGLFAAVASMAAIYEAEATGRGDHVDVAAQEVVVMALENAVQFYELEGIVRRRYGGDQRQAGAGIFNCADGQIILLAGGIGANRFWTRFTAWMDESGVEGAAEFHRPEWLETRFLRSAEAKETFVQIFGAYASTRTKAQLYAEGRARQLPLAPVAGPEEILASPQLAHRGFFVEVWNAERGGEITLPGAPYRLSATPWALRRPAPRLGEHTAEVLADPAWTGGQTAACREART